ncbi:Protein CBR-EGL-9 [Aphelenchoides bicaudatus]|nr:Protein CBR-EGL-9 [Aphelenchoides bicaudatus]
MNSASGESPFKNAAFQFALNNSPDGAFKSFSAVGQSPTTTSIITTTANSNMIVSDATAHQLLMSAASSIASSSGISSVQQPTFDGIFRVPQLPSLRRFNGCNFCGALTSQQDNGPLLQCAGCKATLYCSEEHKKFDSKRHKPMCKTYQMRISRSQSNVSQQEAMDTSGPIKPTAIRPPIDQPLHDFLPKSTSTSSVHSFGAGSSSGFSEISSATQRSAKSDKSMDSGADVDPDIQIIESSSSPRKPRKRPLDASENCPNSKWKDHSKNLLFKTSLQDHMKSLAASGMALNQHQAIALRLRYIAEHVIRSLNEYGWAVVDNFLGKTHCKYTYQEVEELYKRGLFDDGQLVDKKDETPSSTSKDIRSDEIYWFDSSEFRARDAVTIRLLISMIDSVIVHFAKRIPPYTIGGRSRAMIACYPGSGTRYIKHVDNPIRDGRCITSIYYCNDNWVLSEDGGTLRLYPETSQVPMDIDPQADRLVFFWSDHRNPHEVLPVFRHRYAITIWYFDENEKTEALERQKKDNGQKSVSPDSINTENSGSKASSILLHSNVNSAPIPQKPNSPQQPLMPAKAASGAQPVNNKLPPSMQWRQNNRIMEDDSRSITTQSLVDDEENLIVDVENTDQPTTGNYVPNFEI